MNTIDNVVYTQFRTERMGVRDDYHYSDRHGLYGKLSMINPDFMEIQGTIGKLAGDLKHGNKQIIDITDWQAQVYRDNFNMPLIYLSYWFFDQDDILIHARDFKKQIVHAQYYPVALNKSSKSLLGGASMQMTERQWVCFLHHIRGIKVPASLNLGQFSHTWREVKLPTIIGTI